MPTTSAATRATLLLAAALLCCSSQVAGFAVQHQRIGRRRALEYAAAAAAVGTTTESPQPARAEPSKDAEYYEEDVKNDSSLGDPALYTPSVRIDAAGSTNSKLSVVMPKAGGPVTERGFERAPVLSCSCLTDWLLSLTPLLSSRRPSEAP